MCAQIVPWNYPLMMAAWKLAPALAAGCTVVLKPDPQTPLTALRLAELAIEVGFPPGAINVVPGDGPVAGATSSRIPASTRSRSPARRRRAARSCGCAPTRSSGSRSSWAARARASSSPTPTLDEAIPSSVWSIYYSAGQSCEARSRVLVEASLYDEFVARFAEPRGRSRVGDPLDPETQIGSLISPRTASACTASSSAARGGRRGRRRRRARRRQGRVLPADRPRGRRQRDGGRPGGDLRPGRTVIPFEDEKDAIRSRTTCATA